MFHRCDEGARRRLWDRTIEEDNLVPRAFLRRGEDGREKALASAGQFFFLIGWLKCNNYFNFYANVV